MSDMITNPENVTESAGRDDAITAKGSPRPWRVTEYEAGPQDIYDANGFRVCDVLGHPGSTHDLDRANAALIVDAVNAYGEDAEYIQHLKELLAASNAERDRLRDLARRIYNDLAEASNERYRLRDIVRRLADTLQGILDAAEGRGVGMLDEGLVREARAAIGEGSANG